MRQERMKYIIDNGTYVGTLVNYPVTLAQADNLEQLEGMLRAQLKDWIDTTEEFSRNPFEAQEVTAEEWLTNHKREVEKWRSIAEKLYNALIDSDLLNENSWRVVRNTALTKFEENW